MKDEDLQKMRMNGLAKDEADCKRLRIPHRFVHMSALSPSTRDSHAERHGELFTADEIREWSSRENNDVGCKCTFTLVMVDEEGQPRTPALIQKLLSAKEAYLRRRQSS